MQARDYFGEPQLTEGRQSAPDGALAIIGGGQLGMLLCMAARGLGVRTLIVTPDATAPALFFADESIVADLESDGLAARIAGTADIATFEFEAVPRRLLEGLASEEAAGRLVVHPAIATLRLLQNKAEQKQWLVANAFPTLPFRVVQNARAEATELVNEFGLPLVQKAQTGGYDGYGVQIIRSASELDDLWEVPSIVEPCLDQPTELGVVVARSASGELAVYPPVRMTFDHARNILDAVILPSGFTGAIDKRAAQLGREVIDRLGSVGVFAVEMFLTQNDELVINEISPRVHNSGHLTLETAAVSQFEQHVRAVCNLPLAEPGSKAKAAVMRNLLYSARLEPMLAFGPGLVESDNPDVFLYWYGKREGREGRKMGHVTCLCADPDEAARQVDAALGSVRKPASGAAA